MTGTTAAPVEPKQRARRSLAIPGGIRAAGAPALFVLVALLPLAGNATSFTLGLGVTIGFWIIATAGYSVTFGLAGQFSVAHFATVGVGAYATAILMARTGLSLWLSLPCAVALAAIAGGVVGLTAWRLSGDYVSLVTLAAGIMVQQVMLNWTTVTGGPQGIPNIPQVTIGSHIFTDRDYYVLAMILALVCVSVVARLRSSRLGLAFIALRDDELAAQAMGFRVNRLKISSFVIGGALAGVAGALFTVYNGFVSSVSFGVSQSVLVILMVLLGGQGKPWAATLAAAVLTYVTQRLTSLSDTSVGLTGLLILLVMLVRGGAFAAVVGRARRALPVAAGRPLRRRRPSLAERSEEGGPR